MAYYAGGYYAGDYYAGGLFGSIGRAIGRVAKVGIGTVGGFLTGGPAGAIRGTIAAAVPTVVQGIQQETLAAGPSGSAYTPALREKHAQAVARGAGGGAGGAPKPGTAIMVTPPVGLPATMGGAAMMPTAGQLGVRVHGTHLNKQGYFTRAGYVPAGSTLVRNRRMNWGNGRALSRAERRIAAFLKHATRYMKWAHPGKKGHAVPKFHRKRKRAA
jgi:hypothetical protein